MFWRTQRQYSGLRTGRHFFAETEPERALKVESHPFAKPPVLREGPPYANVQGAGPLAINQPKEDPIKTLGFAWILMAESNRFKGWRLLPPAFASFLALSAE